MDIAFTSKSNKGSSFRNREMGSFYTFKKVGKRNFREMLEEH